MTPLGRKRISADAVTLVFSFQWILGHGATGTVCTSCLSSLALLIVCHLDTSRMFGLYYCLDIGIKMSRRT